jgi:hypothetical protein
MRRNSKSSSVAAALFAATQSVGDGKEGRRVGG